MTKPANIEELELEQELSDDIHIQRISVPGGWIYLTYVRRTENGKTYTSAITSTYVPGRR
jgi:hypothetical protein